MSFSGPLPPMSTELTAVTPYDAKTAHHLGKEGVKLPASDETRYSFPRHVVDASKLILSEKIQISFAIFLFASLVMQCFGLRAICE